MCMWVYVLCGCVCVCAWRVFTCVYGVNWMEIGFLLMERSVCVPGADCAPDWWYMWV